MKNIIGNEEAKELCKSLLLMFNQSQEYSIDCHHRGDRDKEVAFNNFHEALSELIDEVFDEEFIDECEQELLNEAEEE